MKWRGEWEFRNVMHHLHGSGGKKIVEAADEQSAKVKIKEAASVDLFGTIMMHTYVVVQNIREDQ